MVPISVDRTVAARSSSSAKEDGEEGVKAVLRISFENGSEKNINVQHKHSSTILEEFIQATGATPVPLEDQPLLKRPDESDQYQ